jgi:hypothetical protein
VRGVARSGRPAQQLHHPQYRKGLVVGVFLCKATQFVTFRALENPRGPHDVVMGTPWAAHRRTDESIIAL